MTTTSVARDYNEAPLATGRVLQVSVSMGGVPKLPVAEASVGPLGLEGDRHRGMTVHGGPHRAVCLLAIEAIQRVADEGHPIEPGSVGENLTTEGIELALLPLGTRLAVGADVLLEISGSADPCDNIAGSFHDGRSGRISILTHPSDSRMYARTLRDGTVRPRDEIRVLPPDSHSMAETHELLDRLEHAEGGAEVALWRAARTAGQDVRYIDDGELRLVAAPALPGPTFNRALGHRSLPHLLPLMVDHFRANEVVGWVLAGEPPWPGATAESEAHLFSAEVGAGIDAGADAHVQGLEVRPIEPDDARVWAARLVDWSPFDALNGRAWVDLAPHLAASSGMTLFAASIDGEPVAVSALFTRIRVGVLRSTSVAPEFRGRGIQRALIAHRARVAAEHGARHLVASASAGSVSEGNLRRMGLEPIWPRTKYRFDGTAGPD